MLDRLLTMSSNWPSRASSTESHQACCCRYSPTPAYRGAELSCGCYRYSGVACRAGYLCPIRRGGPATEKSEGLLGAAAGLGGVDVDCESVVCGELERLVAQL